jgi:hypothetical protein
MMAATQASIRFLRMMPRAFLARTDPAVSMQKPACMMSTKMAAGGRRQADEGLSESDEGNDRK